MGLRVSRTPQDEELIKLLYRTVQDVRVVYHIQDRHGRREQARSQFAPLTAACPHTHAIFPDLPPEPRSDTTILTPCPMLRCLSAKSIALVLIALNDLEETAHGQGDGARRFVDVTESFAYRLRKQAPHICSGLPRR